MSIVKSVAAGLAMTILLVSAAHASAPSDFDLVAVAGASSVGSDYAWIHIDATGHAAFAVNRADTLTAAPLDTVAFTLTAGQLDTLWQVVQNQGFFSLLSNYQDLSSLDGSIVKITVNGNSTRSTVTAMNSDVAALDSIVAVINRYTPGDHDLICSYTPPASYTPQDGCGNTAFARAGGRDAGVGWAAGGTPVTTLGPWTPGAVLEHAQTKFAAQGRAVERRLARPDAVTTVDAPHAGTTVAYHMSIYDALAKGIATVTSKGGFYGDEASLTVDNTAGVKTNDLQTDLYLDLYGPAAGGGVESQISGLIQAAWNGRPVTGGATMTVNVNDQLSTGASPPGTAGFHQILIGDQKTTPAVGRSYVAPLGIINQGSTGGHWNDLPPLLAVQPFAHEAGHLMGLPDRYVTYDKQSDGSWLATADRNANSPCAATYVGTTITPAALAMRLQSRFPTWTQSQIVAHLSQPDIIWSTVPCPGSENDIMATASGDPVQSDIDGFAQQAGLVVDVPAGTVLPNKDPGAQNLLTLRESHMFVPKGQVRTIYGLWTACIDATKEPPSEGVGFDVAPPVSQWTGYASAVAMQKLIDYVNHNGLYCASDLTAQYAVWDLSEGTKPGAADSALFVAAGVSLPLPAGFPHFTDPYAGPDSRSVLPLDLFRPLLVMSPGDVVAPGQTLGLTGTATGFAEPGLSSSLAWTLVPPGGSSSHLSSASGTNSGFKTDVRGNYRIDLRETVTTPTDTFTVDSLRDVMAADAYTETFETGTIRSGAPFHWVTTGDSLWIPNGSFHHTGSFCVVAPPGHPAATLSSTITLSAPGTIQFAYITQVVTAGTSLRFLVDGSVVATYTNTPNWQIASLTIPAGTHTLTWNFHRVSTTSFEAAAIDDICFPLTAQITGVTPTPPVASAAASFGPLRPNPAGAETFIPFALPRAGHVKLAVYDLLGRRVAQLADDEFTAGEHEIRFDTSRLPPGLYSVRIEADGLRATRSLVHLR